VPTEWTYEESLYYLLSLRDAADGGDVAELAKRLDPAALRCAVRAVQEDRDRLRKAVAGAQTGVQSTGIPVDSDPGPKRRWAPRRWAVAGYLHEHGPATQRVIADSLHLSTACVGSVLRDGCGWFVLDGLTYRLTAEGREAAKREGVPG
jgi:hypothetical protein